MDLVHYPPILLILQEIPMVVIIILVGSLVLKAQQEQLYAFCENKTGIINLTGDWSEIDCDCWQDKKCPELKARWEELKEYIKEKFIPLLDKPDDMRRLVRFRREIIRFMEQLESGGNDFESARDKHSVAGVRDCPANSLSKLPKPELEKKGMT